MSVVVVSFNSEDRIFECLESLRFETRPGDQVLVVDNASSDKTVTKIEEEYPEVVIIRRDRNDGYAAAVNIGFEMSKSPYVVVLNDDALLAQGCIDSCVRLLESNSSIGACQPRIMLRDDKERVNSRGNEANILFVGWPDGYTSPPDPRDKLRRIPFASGAVMVVSKRCFRSIGGFDKSYFMYGEDVDFGLRAFLLGWEIVYNPEATAFHKYSFLAPPKKLFLLERNRILTLLKTYRLRTLVFLFPLLLSSEIVIIMRALREGWLTQKLQSYESVLESMDELLSNRNGVQRRRIRPDHDLIELLRGGVYFRGLRNTYVLKWGNCLLERYRDFLLSLRI